MEYGSLHGGEGKEQTPPARALPRSLKQVLQSSIWSRRWVTWPAAKKEQALAAAVAVAATTATLRNQLLRIALAMGVAAAIAYAGFVIYVTATYTHGWIEKLQMVPLCLVAITAPVLCTIMIRK